jgi:acetyl-CoA C-acetyltransferase
MSSSPRIGQVRRVAVVGGSRIPFVRSDGPYVTASRDRG